MKKLLSLINKPERIEMKDLNDKDFDQTFKQRVTETFPEFEEEAWLKMEQKLNRKDRLVFFRNASIILLFLSFGLGLYFLPQKNQKKSTKPQNTIVKNKIQKNSNTDASTPSVPHSTLNFRPTSPIARINAKTIENIEAIKQSAIPFLAVDSENLSSSPITFLTENKQIIISNLIPHDFAIDQPLNTAVAVTDDIKPDGKSIDKSKKARKTPISLAIITGPDFNSTGTVIGGKTSASFGLSVGIGITKKISLQTGLSYGAKNYSAKGYDYTFNNPNIQSSIASIQAKCKVLEVPLRASYTAFENQNQSIDFNGGLSSYFMLKENYVYKYKDVNRNDRTREFTNENQHFLSVLDLSATYNIKLKNTKMALGIEPYVKIPLSGIGEGNVPLKSSGIAFKLRYHIR